MRALAAFAFLAAAFATPAAAQTVVVSGNNNPFLAGQPSGTNCCSGDSAPANSPTLGLSGALGGLVLTFSGTGGFNNSGGTPGATLDGAGLFDMTSNYGTGISGALGVNLNGLVGVFLDGSTPTGTGPAQRNDGLTFASINPGLGQIFWIGDGLTGTGTGATQQFVAPTGATRLFLGASDGFGWFNNSGTGTVTIRVLNANGVPEPATWAMMLLGFGLVGAALRRRAPAVALAA